MTPDLTLAPYADGVRLLPSTVLGMLWLQTHFEHSHWERLSRGTAGVDAEAALLLSADAEEAGLQVSWLQAGEATGSGGRP